MRKGTIAAVTTAILLIIGLIGLGIFLTAVWQGQPAASTEENTPGEQMADTMLQELRALQEKENASDAVGPADAAAGENDANTDSQNNTAQATNEENSESETEPDTEWVLELRAIEDTPVIWVGDSRTVGMQKALGAYSDDMFIGAAGEGYSWLSETGVPFLESAINDYPDRPVIFNMGVNDYENLYNYMILYADVTSRYPDTVFFFLSVNPVDDGAELYVTNAEIEDFNSHLKEAYPDTYLDSYTWLLESGTETIDGIHYSEDAYRQIYLFVKGQMEASA
ncbi:MAG: hypothetical protein LUD18_12275 [Lachnospiraceae bacterium]|nr:hypothetical protein [Lachnospiraceae bacterium]